MAFANPSPAAIAALLRSARVIAVVGLSDNPHRPSYEVAAALLDYGYRIIPVSPALSVWEGIRAVPDLDHVADALSPGEHVDIVDVFRQPQHVDDIVADCLRLRFPALWLQLGVINESAAERAVAGGMTVVMDKCIKVERMRMG
ncbi:MAG TPA: CoA-binding protein [Povalibacter sp.]|uniref:CoA-binding protein n=1 Tax=Povalibacter sp. TaxID=1962978 RepID=UPI002C0DEF25|nr:CoA-binding protein [Povalibacter sp.]HMN44263.1 CoA-binding protein [Povalibacter sp.]